LSAARKQKESISTIPGNQFQGLKQHIYGNKEQTTRISDKNQALEEENQDQGNHTVPGSGNMYRSRSDKKTCKKKKDKRKVTTLSRV
jgi:hypothetical protein